MLRQRVVSRARFNRWARQLLPVVNAIRLDLTKDDVCPSQLAIIDSLSNPLCAKVRNFRVIILPMWPVSA